VVVSFRFNGSGHGESSSDDGVDSNGCESVTGGDSGANSSEVAWHKDPE